MPYNSVGKQTALSVMVHMVLLFAEGKEEDTSV